MALETGTYISDLNLNNPVGATDTVSSLDDHIRLIKKTILNTFPNIDGAVTATPTQMNQLVSNVALLDDDNIFTTTQRHTSSAPIVALTNSSADANEQRWDVAVETDGDFQIATRDDLAGFGEYALKVTRSGVEVTAVALTGDSITANGNAVLTTATTHDSLSGFVANEHIDHSGVSIVAGAGLTGGGDITASRTLNVVGGDGITANANDIAVDSTVARTTGDTFTGDIVMSGTRAIDGTTRLNLTGSTVCLGESGGIVGFFGDAGTSKFEVTGSRSDGTALDDLLDSLAAMGLLTNSSQL